MTESQYEREEYLEQDDNERENAGRFKSVIALAVLGVLVIVGVVLANKLRNVSQLQDCLMTRATNCAQIDAPQK
ncbi:MAG: hypothetical protein ACHQK9_19170 [Reyranellales bacterium]